MRLAALIEKRLGIKVAVSRGKIGQFEVRADGEKVVERGGNWFTRLFGAGYPNMNSVLDLLQTRVAKLR